MNSPSSKSSPLRLRFLPVVLLAPALLAQSTAPAPTPTVVSARQEEPVSLSVFEVTTSKDIGYQSANAAEATRMNMPIENIPMNVTVFNQQFIEDLVATDSSQLLAYEASAVKTTENDGFLARGSASVGTNFLNGFAQTSGFGSQPLANIERVEVIRGPAAVLYGSGGYGGTFNRITKQPQPRQFTSARAIFSDRSSIRSEVDFNSPLPFGDGKKLMFRVNAIFDRGYTWFGQRKEEDGLAPSLRWDISPRTKLILEYFYNWRENQASWETPVHAGDPKGMVLGNGTYRTIPRKVGWMDEGDYRRNTRHVASTDFRHAFTNDLQFRSQFQFETKEQRHQETQALSDGLTILNDTALMPRLWREIPRDTDNYRTRSELVWNLKTGPIQHRLLGGHGWTQQYDLNIVRRSARSNGGMSAAVLAGDGRVADAVAQAGPLFNQYNNVTYAQFIANPTLAGFHRSLLTPINLFDRGAEPDLPSIANRPPLFLDTETKTYVSTNEFYLNDVFSLADERVFVMGGLRYTKFNRKIITYASGTLPNKVRLASPPTAYTIADATTKSIGAVWHLNTAKTYSLYANLNNSFNPEYRAQPDGSALDPEEGNQKEIGLRFSLLKGRISGLVTYFDLLQDNVTQADPAPGRTGYFIQVSGQRSTGIELSFNARVTDEWLLMGGFSDTDARNDITGVGKDLSPRFKFTMFNRYNFTRGALKNLSLSLGTIYTSDRPLTIANARGEPNWGPLPEWWRFDVIVGYKLRIPQSRFSWDFSVKVNNVRDNTDIYYVGQWYRYTLDPGREWLAVATVRF
jgi:iron complex outermembrane receptor protein